jgi:hypothetical protein
LEALDGCTEIGAIEEKALEQGRIVHSEWICELFVEPDFFQAPPSDVVDFCQPPRPPLEATHSEIVPRQAVPFIGEFNGGNSSSFSNDARILGFPSSVHGAMIASELRIRESGWRVREDVAATERNKSEATVESYKAYAESLKLVGRLVDDNNKTKDEVIGRLKGELHTKRNAEANSDANGFRDLHDLVNERFDEMNENQEVRFDQLAEDQVVLVERVVNTPHKSTITSAKPPTKAGHGMVRMHRPINLLVVLLCLMFYFRPRKTTPLRKKIHFAEVDPGTTTQVHVPDEVPNFCKCKLLCDFHLFSPIYSSHLMSCCDQWTHARGPTNRLAKTLPSR